MKHEPEDNSMKRETFCKDTIAGLDVTQVPNKTIVLPFDQETYPKFITDKPAYKAHVNMWIEAAPELFLFTIQTIPCSEAALENEPGCC